MNDVTAVQAAAWLGAQVLWLYAAMAILLAAVTLIGWRLLAHRAAVTTQVMRLAAGCAVATLSAMTFAWLAKELRAGPQLSALDEAFTHALAHAIPDAVVRAASLLTRLGDPATLTALGVVVGVALLMRRHVGLMLGWAVALGGNGLLNPALKEFFMRMRPLRGADGASAEGFSFPSGHSSGTVVAFGMLAYLGLRLLPPRWHLPVLLAAVLLAFSVGISRVLLRVHYASDVAAGFASGTAWLALCITGIGLCRWLAHRAQL
ncbi:MAG: phosphatase PAP2 family protein [Burkholderiaceae bacterium]